MHAKEKGEMWYKHINHWHNALLIKVLLLTEDEM
jgi:hypothetical protein